MSASEAPDVATVGSGALFGIWLPIETAPQNGTEMLGWREDCGVILIRWDCLAEMLTEDEYKAAEQTEESGWQYNWMCADFVSGCTLDGDEVPTHWMPLPDAPNV